MTKSQLATRPAPDGAPPALPPASWASPVEYAEPVEDRYPTRPVRPVGQLAARVGLWGLVALGAVGGCVGVLRPPATSPPPQVIDTGDAQDVPAPVAGTAERAVTAWLTAGDGDAEELGTLFLAPPDVNQIDTDTLTVVDVSTVTARRVEDGYWTVTVAVDLLEQAPLTDDGERGDPLPATWHVEVGIAGDVDSGLAAVETPSIVPPPVAVGNRWLPDRDSAETPEPGDPLVAAVEGFLSAFLTGRGDPARYVAPGLDVVALDPAPFAQVVLIEMAVERGDDATAIVWAEVEVSTEAGARQVVAYDMAWAQRSGRWEITELPGVASHVGSAQEGASDGSPPGASETTTPSDDAGPLDGTPSGSDPTTATSVPGSGFEPDDGA